MWLITTLIAAVLVTLAYFLTKNKEYKLNLLALMLWGTFIMVLVDSLGFLSEGGEFIELTTNGLISSGVLLGVTMLIPIIAVWLIAVFSPLKNKICID